MVRQRGKKKGRAEPTSTVLSRRQLSTEYFLGKEISVGNQRSCVGFCAVQSGTEILWTEAFLEGGCCGTRDIYFQLFLIIIPLERYLGFVLRNHSSRAVKHGWETFTQNTFKTRKLRAWGSEGVDLANSAYSLDWYNLLCDDPSIALCDKGLEDSNNQAQLEWQFQVQFKLSMDYTKTLEQQWTNAGGLFWYWFNVT